MGRRKHARVMLTWDALATLRVELERADRQCPDSRLIAGVLRRWGRKELEQRSVSSLASLMLPELVLSFDGGLASDAPRRLLERDGLL